MFVFLASIIQTTSFLVQRFRWKYEPANLHHSQNFNCNIMVSMSHCLRQVALISELYLVVICQEVQSPRFRYTPGAVHAKTNTAKGGSGPISLAKEMKLISTLTVFHGDD